MIHGSDAYQGQLSQRIQELEATCVRWAKQVDDLEAECDRLREALEKYGEHEYDCMLVPCTCGLDEALKKADTK